MSPPYTAITFAPVQGFIEKSRKLRDLYGSSFILSYIAYSLCQDIKAKLGEQAIISPALLNLAQGTPNIILIQGEYSETDARQSVKKAWNSIAQGVRQWIEDRVKDKNGRAYRYTWEREWNQWINHTWEFFYAKGDSITEARQKLSEVKRQRDWTGINWKGESSTLSGADGIAWADMGATHPLNPNPDAAIKSFYKDLSNIASESLITPREQLSIPELIKRLITREDIATKVIGLGKKDLPESFAELAEDPQGMGWFQGDGDRMGKYLAKLANNPSSEADNIRKFSKALREWGKNTLEASINQNIGRIIYAGGDDFLGVFFDNKNNLKPQTCLNWFYKFRDQVWNQHTYGSEITVSVGFVWSAKNVPQRDVLQHCREAEKSAKSNGRDRLALRVLFSGGNYLEWVCPWWMLEDVLEAYSDRSGGKNWTHIYNDIATLESRHAFDNKQTEVALALFELYFGAENRQKITTNRWNSETNSGILGEESHYLRRNTNQEDVARVNAAINNWIINLAKIGFHLCSST